MFNILNDGVGYIPAFKGDDGKSAYEIAVEDGFVGTEEGWLESLTGASGETPDIQIGTVTTLEPEEPATVTRTGTNEEPIFNFGIPRGDVSVSVDGAGLKDPAKTYLVIKIPEGDNTFTLLTGTDGDPDYTIDWGDGASDNITGIANPSHEYATAGMYLITISDNFTNGFMYGPYSNENKDKIIEVYGGSNYPLSIENFAFSGCSSLTTANFPNVTDVGNRVFQFCSSLTTASIPNTTNVGSAFMDCSSLKEANFPRVKTIDGELAFINCSSLTTANFPEVTNIEGGAFSGCSSLTTVNFPNLTSIEDSVFSNCTSLTTASIPNAESIGAYAFRDCSSLKDLTIGNISTTQTSSNTRFQNVKLVNLTIAQDVSEADINRIKQFYADNEGTFTGAQINSI